MAINRVPFPENTPTATSDYQKQNNLLETLAINIENAIRIQGSNVVEGAIFNIGGTYYLADSDTAITGTSSDYVKLTPSGGGDTASASYVANLSGVTWNATYNHYEDVSGNLYIFNEAVANIEGELSSEYNYRYVRQENNGDVYFSNNVGIGISSPLSSLHIYDGASGATPNVNTVLTLEDSNTFYLSLLSPSTTNAGIFWGDESSNSVGRLVYDHTTDCIQLWTNGARQLDIDSGGNVGIGISSPLSSLHIYDGASGATPNVNTVLTLEDSNTFYLSMLSPSTTSASIFWGDELSNSVGRLTYDHTTDGMQFWTNGARQLDIDSGGNVGIGISSPLSSLHVYDGASGATPNANTVLTIEDSNTFYISLLSPSTTNAAIFWGDESDDDVGRIVYDHNDDGMQFWTNGDRQVNIDSSGNLGVGIASPQSTGHIYDGASGATPNANTVLTLEDSNTFYLSLLSPSTTNAAIFWGDESDNDVGRIVYDHNDDGLQFWTAGARQVNIDSAGSMGVGIAAPQSTTHIYDGASGATPNANTVLTIEDSNTFYISLLSPSSTNAAIFWGDESANDVGRIVYDHATNGMQFWTNGSKQIDIDSTGRMDVDGVIATTIGVYIADSIEISSAVTQNTVFDNLSSYIPNNGDKIKLTGGYVSSLLTDPIDAIYAERVTGTAIVIHGFQANGSNAVTETATDGSGVNFATGMSIAW